MSLRLQTNTRQGACHMSAVAFYNLKGGVGKTTAAVNVAYLAAAAGQRVLLWDLDPQGASSFILRVRAHVGALRRKTLRHGAVFADAIKETDYPNLDLLPADFSYRKFDRVLDHLGKPVRVMRTLLDTVGSDYDIVFLDCPAGFSLLTEAVLETADLCLVPTIPTPLSVQTLARILKWIDRRRPSAHLAAFFSMVDRRRTLHRRACEWSTEHRGQFLDTHIPSASVVEQISVRRMPLPEFAERDPASAAFADLWSELRARLDQQDRSSDQAGLRPALSAIESLSAELERALQRELRGESLTPVINLQERATFRRHQRAAFAPDMAGQPTLVHSFDTDDRDLSRSGHALELRECTTALVLVAGPANADDGDRAQVRLDRSWALQILSGQVSPLLILDRRLGRPGPSAVEEIRSVVGKRKLCRVESRMVGESHTTGQEGIGSDEPGAAIYA
jgi:chromosome partitioning protein